MRTTLLTRQHERCLDLLEMISRLDRRISDHKEFFFAAKEGTAFYRMADWHFKRWEINLAMKERLVNSYSVTLTKIIKPTVDKILQAV